MESWLTAALIALVLYGFWGFLPKIAVTHINPMSALVYEIAGGLLVGLVALAWLGFKPQYTPKGFAAAFFTGVTGITGTLFFFYALTRGKVSITVCMTALYPIITLILAAVIFHEPITVRQYIGVACALLAIFLLSG